MPAFSPRSLFLLPLSCLCACADGGKEDRPQSDVKIAANHHLYGFRTLPGFGVFPVKPEAAFPDRGTMSMTSDSTYTIIRPSGTTAPDSYAIANDGALAILVSGGGRESSVVFRGAYSRTLVAADVPAPFFFTDRVSAGSSTALGIYYGLPFVSGQIELAGAWHVVSLHTIFAGASALLDPDNVGRAAHGAITVATDAPGTERTISGTGIESTNATLTLTGAIQNLLSGSPPSGNGTLNLRLGYQAGASAVDMRACVAAATNDLVFALDHDETDEEAGIVLMLRKFDTVNAPAESARIAGTYLIGGHTLFVNPSNSGSDAFIGTLTLTAQGGFRLDAVGSRAIDFTASGTWESSADGSITLRDPTASETWFAAVSRDYSVLIGIDAQVTSAARNSELNLVLGVRERTGS